ncbi:MAG: tRNA pseudouridine(55) synthase TruB [Candidatus Aminicenantes bacterium]|nr:tRNA pseudouridine(55) synthase TruB [Candidatus Aminicenantes bacterium]
MDGLVCVDKPARWTSHDVVARLRTILRTSRAGHAGTLDPDATGVLLVTVGQATRLFPFLSKQDKVYRGTIRLGFATDTYDASGRPTTEEAKELPGPQEVEAVVKTLQGRLTQTPPSFSAKKIHGRPAHRLARASREVVLAPVEVTVHAFRLLEYRPPRLEFEVACSSGTYIRALAHDVGSALGCGGHLERLIRTAVGPYRLESCLPWDRIRDLASAGRTGDFLIPMDELLPEFPRLLLTPEQAGRARHGLAIPFPPDAPAISSGSLPVRLFDDQEKFIALARLDETASRLRPFLVITAGT